MREIRSIVAAVVAASLLLPQASSQVAAQRDDSLPLFRTRHSLRSVEDATLSRLLTSLQDIGPILPTRENTAIVIPHGGQQILLIPLDDFRNTSRALYLYYLPESQRYYFLQIGLNEARAPEVRLWGSSQDELFISAEGLRLLKDPSQHTFRIPRTNDRIGGLFHDPGHALSCLGQGLGIGFDLTSLQNTLASIVCTGGNLLPAAFGLLLTATNCLSIAGIGANLVFATFGCLSGIGHLVACGLVACPDGSGGGVETALSNNVPISNISGSSGSERHYTITVPPGATRLEVTTSGGSGDLDLYVRRSQRASRSASDCSSGSSNNDESCTMTNPASGTWYVMLYGYSAYSGTTLRATYGTGGGGGGTTGVTELQNNSPAGNLGGSTGDLRHFRILVPSGVSRLTVTLSGGPGDADIYVRSGQQATTTSYTCSSTGGTNSESCQINSPTSGYWYILIHAYSTYSGATLRASY